MMRFRMLIAGLLISGASLPAIAAAPWSTSLVCSFQIGTSASHNGTVFKRKRAAPITFDVVAIDVDGQSAKIVPKPGAVPEPMRIVRALNANHFIEVLTEGFISVTTIYDADKKGLHPAVHSRHVGVVGQPLVAHYTGSCRSKS